MFGAQKLLFVSKTVNNQMSQSRQKSEPEIPATTTIEILSTT